MEPSARDSKCGSAVTATRKKKSVKQKRKLGKPVSKIVFNTINTSLMSKKAKKKRTDIVTPAFEAFVNGEGTVTDRREISTVFNMIVFLSREEDDLLNGDVDTFLSVCRTNIVNTAQRFYRDSDPSITEDEVEVFTALYTLYLDVLDNVGSGYIEKAEEDAMKHARSMTRSESPHDQFSTKTTAAPAEASTSV